jgi:AraC family transcriptional regulator of adaptative response / DNA-3-methyladenine glycosylase II
MRRTFGRAPSDLRRSAREKVAAGPERYRFRLAYRPPYDWESLLGFLAVRVTPGVESVSDGRYRRTIQIDGKVGVIDVCHLPSRGALGVEVHFPEPRALLPIVERIRWLFDLGADPRIIGAQLGGDRLLAGPLSAWPGIRSPGAWDGFEVAVHALLGGPRALRASTALAGRLASLFGSPVANADGLSRLFPTPAQLAEAPIERAGVAPPRAAAIRSIAGRIAAQGIGNADSGAIAALSALETVDDDVLQYAAMRSPGEPDAFPRGDAALRRAAGGCTARALERRSAAWRPWRAYAALLLWRHAASNGIATKRPVFPPRTSRSERTPLRLEDQWPIGLTER